MYTPGKQYNLYELLQKADDGDLEAMEDAVSVLVAEGYTEDDPDGEIAARQVSYLKSLVDAGRTFACIMLADAYIKGDGVEKDPMEALRLYEKAAERGIRFGNECIGMMYYEGTDIPQDFQKAFEYFTKDEGKKSPCTAYSLGEMYRKGLYVTLDDEKACEYYDLIVNDDGPSPEMDDYYWRACFRLGTAMHYGTGTKKDLDGAGELLSNAKTLYESRGEHAVDSDISKDELYKEWMLLNQDAGKY